jgi:hypothetical protein
MQIDNDMYFMIIDHGKKLIQRLGSVLVIKCTTLLTCIENSYFIRAVQGGLTNTFAGPPRAWWSRCERCFIQNPIHFYFRWSDSLKAPLAIPII